MRYYKPTAEELVIGLTIEFYADSKWHPHIVEHLKGWHKYLENDDIRVRYVDYTDFNELGYIIRKTFLGKQTYIIDIIEHEDKEDEEVTEERDMFNEEILTILKDNVPVGVFLPYAPNVDYFYNIKYEGKKHIIKNLYELRKILK